MTMQPYTGPVEGVLRSDELEVLRDLMAVVEAAEDKPVKLTKSGVPPKPLWSGINDRLLWQDPKGVLHDWDEVDQVRFVYLLAVQLGLVLHDVERNVLAWPGAERFFLASPMRRAAMLRAAYVELQDWDERYDARNEHGHRLHFGQTFRRDFLLGPDELRRAVFAVLATAQPDQWYTADELAITLTAEEPSLLVAEDDDPPDVDEGAAHPEVLRFVNYWLVQIAARFGWVHLARTPEVSIDQPATRLFQATPLLAELLTGDPIAWGGEGPDPARRPHVIQPNGDVVLYRDVADPGDEFLLRRLADLSAGPRGWDEPVVTYTLTLESLQRAAAAGVNRDAIDERLLGLCQQDVPPNVGALFSDAFGAIERRAVVSGGYTAVELEGVDEVARDALAAIGIPVYGATALVPNDRWEAFVRVLGFEPTEGFEYPSAEPLARVRQTLIHMEWPVLPLAARDLLEALGVKGDPMQAPLNADVVRDLGAGWTVRSVAEALRLIADDELPAWLAAGLDR